MARVPSGLPHWLSEDLLRAAKNCSWLERPSSLGSESGADSTRLDPCRDDDACLRVSSSRGQVVGAADEEKHADDHQQDQRDRACVLEQPRLPGGQDLG
jgi:hypothetical protein